MQEKALRRILWWSDRFPCASDPEEVIATNVGKATNPMGVFTQNDRAIPEKLGLSVRNTIFNRAVVIAPAINLETAMGNR